MSDFDSVEQAKGGIYALPIIGLITLVAGIVTGSLGTIAIALVVTAGALLFIKLDR